MKNFNFPMIEDQYDQKLISDVNNTGFHIIGIEKDDGGPEYAFTVGLYYTYKHPEILIMGINNKVCFEFFHLIADRIKNGTNFIDGKVDKELASFPIHFKSIKLDFYKEYFGYAAWFYQSLPEPFPAVQFIWPDRNGIFPWEDKYDKAFFSLQRILC